MKNISTNVDGAYLIEFDRFNDQRGYFEEIYNSSKNYPHLVGMQRQINLSVSDKMVIRGLHVSPFSKLITCVRGRIYDVVADVRKNSKTYLEYYGVWLEEQSLRQVFVPAGCAHGFFSDEDKSTVCYLQDGVYNPQVEYEVNWKDPELNIKWPQSPKYILSQKDSMAKVLRKINV